jgi:Mrp family chromosome partitioning ATPase/predicted Fe-Mo cluster-binding NifX family protein
MESNSQTCSSAGQNDQHNIQDAVIKEKLNHIKNKILVMSGKGGVGKSSIAAILSLALAKNGFSVGLMDVDLHGPSIPRMLGLYENITQSPEKNKILPLRHESNLNVISIEPLLGENKDTATIWRGPLKIGVIRQFISDIELPDLDYLIIDSPPGTGDEPLTVIQTIPDAKALVVTTPQEISLADVRKSINFCRQVNMDILGIVENMAGLTCEHCGSVINLFRSQGGEQTAREQNLPLLGSLPIEPDVVKLGDVGRLKFLTDLDIPYNKEFQNIKEKIIASFTDTKKDISSNSKEENMDKTIFAVPTAQGSLCAHFGHCEQFAIIEVEDGKIEKTTMQTPPPHEPGVLPQWLGQMGVNIVIAGGMGSRAQQLFAENGAKVITGAPMGTPESIVNQYLTDTLITGDNACDH